MTDTVKNILVGVVIIVVLFAAYKLLVPKKELETPLSTNTPISKKIRTSFTTTEEPVTLQKIRKIEIDTAVFSSEAFKSLKDFRVKILPEAVGRDNPFAPIE